MNVMNWRDVKPEDLIFDAGLRKLSPQANMLNFKVRNKTTGESDQLYITGPKMYLPFGLSDYKKNESDSSKYSINAKASLSGVKFNHREEKWVGDSEEMLDFFNWLNSIDAVVLNHMKANKESYFTNENTRHDSVIESRFNTMVFRDANSKYAPLFKMKVYIGGPNGTHLFDGDRKPMKIEGELEDGQFKGYAIRPLLNISKIWFSSVGFGILVQVKQAILQDNSTDWSTCMIESEPVPFSSPTSSPSASTDVAEEAVVVPELAESPVKDATAAKRKAEDAPKEDDDKSSKKVKK